jgi:ABC-type proline/glycine betaine transport system substrate-binding protein
MVKLVNAALAAGFLLVVAAPAFAADAPKTKAECTKAKMKWDAAKKTCSKK